MNILIIDTATSVELVGVSSGGRISGMSNATEVSHSVSLFENIDRALNENCLGIMDIGLIGVGVGPGSFTGIRIAVSTARMLSQLLEKPLVGLKTHLIYAVSACFMTGIKHENILVAFDARKGRVFGALYRRGSDIYSPFEIVPPGDYSVDFIFGKIDISGRTIAIGSGSEKYKEKFGKIQGLDIEMEFRPDAAAACSLTEFCYRKNPALYKNIETTVPFYSRKSDAEIMRDVRKKK